MNAKKIVTIVGLLLVCAVLVWWVGSAVVEAWHGYKWQKQTDAFMEAGRKPYKEDMYGGQTPEETWKMFLAALKKGDVDLASKYFVVEKQEKEKEFLKKENDFDKTNKIYNSLTSEKGIVGDYAYYNIKMPYKDSKSGYIYSPVVFSFNTYTKIWKISTL